MVAIGCIWRLFFEVKNQPKVFVSKWIDLAGVGPEKAGVGGSIPSLATINFKHLHSRFQHFCSNSFQNHGARGSSRLGMLENNAL